MKILKNRKKSDQVFNPNFKMILDQKAGMLNLEIRELKKLIGEIELTVKNSKSENENLGFDMKNRVQKSVRKLDEFFFETKKNFLEIEGKIFFFENFYREN